MAELKSKKTTTKEHKDTLSLRSAEPASALAPRIELQKVVHAEKLQELPLGREYSNYYYPEALTELLQNQSGGGPWTFSPDVAEFIAQLFMDSDGLKEVRESQIFAAAQQQYAKHNPDAMMFPAQEVKELLDLGYRWGLFQKEYYPDPTDNLNRLVTYALTERSQSLIAIHKPNISSEYQHTDDTTTQNDLSNSLSLSQPVDYHFDPLIPPEQILSKLEKGIFIEEYELLDRFLSPAPDERTFAAIENAFYLNIKILADRGLIRKSGSDGEYFYSQALGAVA